MDSECAIRDSSQGQATQTLPAAATLQSLDLATLRLAQRRWAATPLRDRTAWVTRVRHAIADRSDQLIASVTASFRNGAAETLAAEIIPLADACRFLEAYATKLLSPTRPSNKLRPNWLRTTSLEVHREPFGTVLVMGPANYPLFLPGVQMLQALVAGNAVVLKPGRDSTTAAQELRKLFFDAGLDHELIRILPEEVGSFDLAIEAGVDKVVLTGSATTGRIVQRRLAETLTPAAMELSGCDSVFVLPSADLDRAAQAIKFGLRFNQSATCIAPRRVFVPRDLINAMVDRLSATLADASGAESDEPRSASTNSDVPDHLAVDRSSRIDRSTANLIREALDHGAKLLHGHVSNDDRIQYPVVLLHESMNSRLFNTDVFAPIVNLFAYDSLDEAVEINEACPFGLGSTIFGEPAAAQKLASQLHVGCVVINDMIAPTADPRLPFGGRQQSGFGVTRGAEGLLEMTQSKAIVTQRGSWLPHLDEPSPYDASLLAGFLRLTHAQKLNQKFSGLAAVVKAAMDQHKWKARRKST